MIEVGQAGIANSFGAARFAIGEQHPKSLTVIIKDGYAPIEQYFTRGVQGPWTDVYSIGATFYRCITGKLPPAAPERQQKDILAPPTKAGAQLPRALEKAIVRALEVRAENRFQSVVEMQQAILPAENDSQGPSTLKKVGIACLLTLALLLVGVGLLFVMQAILFEGGLLIAFGMILAGFSWRLRRQFLGRSGSTQ